MKIEDNLRDQVVIIFRDRPIHVALHKTEYGILRTVLDEKKPITGGGRARIDIAKKLRYKNPEKHAKYIAHNMLIKCDNDTRGYHLVGRTINLKDCSKANKYKSTISIPTDKSKFLLELYLSTKDNLNKTLKGKSIILSFGELYLDIINTPKVIGNIC
jgi:hypothetical protein